MKQDIILCGVGGQGILSIATVIGQAATTAGVQLKQAEVHGMSQRGGDVQSNLRLSTDIIYSDLIALGGADLIISMEPMEALRYKQFLAEGGAVVSSTEPLVNINAYPPLEAVLGELESLPRFKGLQTGSIAKDLGTPKSSNMVLLGMASRYMTILTPSQLREAIVKVFAAKGEAIVEANLKAFDAGYGA